MITGVTDSRLMNAFTSKEFVALAFVTHGAHAWVGRTTIKRTMCELAQHGR